MFSHVCGLPSCLTLSLKPSRKQKPDEAHGKFTDSSGCEHFWKQRKWLTQQNVKQRSSSFFSRNFNACMLHIIPLIYYSRACKQIVHFYFKNRFSLSGQCHLFLATTCVQTCTVQHVDFDLPPIWLFTNETCHILLLNLIKTFIKTAVITTLDGWFSTADNMKANVYIRWCD